MRIPTNSFKNEVSKDPGNEKSGGWIYTYSGVLILPLDPKPEHIEVLDIAHALANGCRFTGHTRKHYSIAQHSVLVSEVVPEEDALCGLFHDASEAYLSDIAGPVKRVHGAFGDFYKEAEDRLMAAISERFGFPFPMSGSVKEADLMVLRAEQRDLMPNDPSEGPIYGETIEPWTPDEAKWRFLKRYSEITGEGQDSYISYRRFTPGQGFKTIKRTTV